MKKIIPGVRFLDDGDPWMLGEEIPDCDLFFSQIWVSGFVKEFGKYIGRMYRKILTIYRGYHLWFYYGERDSNAVGEHIVQKFLANPSFARRVNREIVRASDRLRAFAKTVPESGLEKLSATRLWHLWKTHDDLHTAYYQWGWLPVAADMFHNNFTNALMVYLTEKMPEQGRAEAFALLTQPTRVSLIQKEQEDFLRIAALIQSRRPQAKLFKDLYTVFSEQEASALGLAPHTPAYEERLEERAQTLRQKIAPAVLRRIEKHFETHFCMKHMWIGKDGVYSFEHYVKELVKFIGKNANARALLRETTTAFERTFRKRRLLLRKLGVTGRWRTLFDAFGNFMVTKIYRRYAQIYAIYRMQPVIEEVARRLRFSKMQVRFMLTSEVRAALLRGKVDRSELARRTTFCAYYVERGKEIVVTGTPAKKLAALIAPKKISTVEEIRGQVGCVGKATGTVKLIFRPSDMAKMREGDVLVSIATDPDIVPAMKKAAAIVTEQGGVTSHAAIVSRELNIPCVIGTKIATKVLKDGDRVEVDATKGTVRKIG